MSKSQKFLGRNCPPRVQIEYEALEGEKKVQIPFLVGVMADLSGKSADELPDLGERTFEDINQDNFDIVLRSAKPRVAFYVKDTVANQGEMAVDITFTSMEDFSPARVAEKIEPIRKLLDVRKRLEMLKSKMDGKGKLVKMLEQLVADEPLLRSIASEDATEEKK